MKKYIFIISILSLMAISCQKEFLEKRPNKALLVPETLTDFQNLLDNTDVFNIAPSLPVIASDDFYGTDIRVNAYIDAYQKNSYIWADNIDEGLPMLDWNTPFQQILYSNIILDGLKKLSATSENNPESDRIKGSALFHRAFAYYNLAQMYAKPYNANSADSDLGIPIRLQADVNIKSKRGTLSQTYGQIINDLQDAEALLPVTSSFQSRPNKVAVKALLARLYLNMEDYPKALKYADETYVLNNSLIDFNTLNKTTTNPFPVAPNSNNNVEIIFYSRMTTYTFGISQNSTVENTLYESYNSNDLRKIIYFISGNPANFKGRYTGNLGRHFGGLTTSEVFLIKAECEARVGSYNDAMITLNNLIKKRWDNSVTYPILTAINAKEALAKILTERRKELVFKGLRWGDLRRLNKDARFAKTITRTFNNQTYTLEPNSKKYTFPIPTMEIVASGIEQN
jgi:tetratricopeptide (TPR) repeat protein